MSLDPIIMKLGTIYDRIIFEIFKKYFFMDQLTRKAFATNFVKKGIQWLSSTSTHWA